ncbi:phosphopantothenate--cysteine ligase [Streptococcus uberis]|uniref:phosphopantothenate--cysteine ligase n=1 Tax=Streptococcus uberis TaxID=1349 RepID=UPI0006203059|nr:phosphopantothenate--cysteine ligase [Streptococcus uberis]KKF44007.1 phosphopantothenate--cysteine ligase [Streptococcus uberis EF20/0145]KKF56436.1 phosphopantothenate--cysteine ligase [Streptococcus uberis 6780]MCK1166643.1 phosphopantothenate--cysteine ligase [Streptococcus uberis]MCK1194962.1 phosphopantothenate--cysteine ligase [Streptococcus uberis]MCK1195965.1 phosphopantothenate--cysteine ligase [Streptococcus uberis]
MKILITSGGTTEQIDSVRGITNHSTGKLGKEMAEHFLKAGHQVSLVTTKAAVKPNASEQLSIYHITNVASLIQTLKPLVENHDVLIHCMAVSDYTPVYMTDLEEVKETTDIETLLKKSNQETKISSSSDVQVLFLKKTPKVISMVKEWNPNIQLIGFKLLVDVTEDQLISVAKDSLTKNKADYIVANDLATISADSHKALLVSKDEVLSLATKSEIAETLLKKVTYYD